MSADKIGATVEKALDATLWRLITGEIALHELTPALAGFYTIGHAHGVESVLERLRNTEHERDRYYELWTNPGTQLTDIRLRRMREAAEDYWRVFVATDGGTR
ncbi:hypothetical protein EDM22_13805 [Agromyces tardus]|uniref:Uncharacterized protein n=1 Tax=Agromyces tardus TaxID=2583849 RepID=A0A3M8A7V5_9MICO|nr:hypothetical protein [Agromyces tardus]RNB46545.1 hypothetical protein EDM22_13805 [Agromyces tardus]